MEPPVGTYTIPQFCATHNISRSKFYHLFDLGLAPETIVVIGQRLITVEAAERWRRRMGELTDPRSKIRTPKPRKAA